jgi:lipopolysaccharide cholinephosphotransferase
MNKKALSLKEHQDILYELLYALDNFCQEHKIKYFLGYGSLLGAIRHQGIIPWDDDADVMMEREEYERFQKLIIKKPPKGFKAYSIYNTPGYYYPFIKFGKEGTLLIEPFKYVPKEGIGINIDVFPLDGCPGDTREQACNYASLFFPNYYSKLQKYFQPIYKNEKKSIKKIAKFLFYLLPKPSLIQKAYFKHIYRKASQYACNDTDYYSCISWSFNGDRNVHLCSLIKKTRRVPFGNRALPIPVGFDQILYEEYGNYMTPPDEDKRKSTHEHGVVYRIIN